MARKRAGKTIAINHKMLGPCAAILHAELIHGDGLIMVGTSFAQST